MNKTIRSSLYEAEIKQHDWISIANDPKALSDRNKTREEALRLADYWEGKADGFREALYMVKEK